MQSSFLNIDILGDHMHKTNSLPIHERSEHTKPPKSPKVAGYHFAVGLLLTRNQRQNTCEIRFQILLTTWISATIQEEKNSQENRKRTTFQMSWSTVDGFEGDVWLSAACLQAETHSLITIIRWSLPPLLHETFFWQ